MTRRTMLVASFAPELIELFRRGARDSVRITLRNEKDAMRARQRMYDLRKALRAEKHSLAVIAERAQVRREGNILIVEPKDLDLAVTLREQDIRTDATFDEEPAGTPITDEQAQKALTDFLEK